MKRALIPALALLLLCPPHSLAQETHYMRSPRLGINHISGVEEVTAPERYQKALELGAGWNRWPLYWDRVEREAGKFDWSGYDRLVSDDLDQGLSINAILLGTPEFYRADIRISGLQQPIFKDGSDTPKEGKSLNPENPWVNFVYGAVRRYKPAGELAEEQGWSDERGIRIWEIWNEPDYKPFWEANIYDYARLLKTAYLIIKMVDPEAQVMFGGLLYPSTDNWLARVLAIYEDDPFHEQYNWYLDMIAVHSYSYPWRSGWLIRWVRQTLVAYKLKRPIWLNESGVPVWDDYPGPIWAEKPEEKQLRATLEQQANFFIQSTAYALAEGADVIFYHQLYDDCGNQPGGTDFPYHLSATCPKGDICVGDAFGLYRNTREAVCFSHSLQPGTARPSAAAYRLVADLFGEGKLDNPNIEVIRNWVTVITFDRHETNERLYVIWNNTLSPLQLDLPIGADQVRLFSLEGQAERTPDDEGILRLDLPAAKCDFYPFLNPGDVTGIGGETTIILAPLQGSEKAPSLVERPQSTRLRCPKVSSVGSS
jgi:hypothetical protein